MRTYLWWSLHTLYLLARQVELPLAIQVFVVVCLSGTTRHRCIIYVRWYVGPKEPFATISAYIVLCGNCLQTILSTLYVYVYRKYYLRVTMYRVSAQGSLEYIINLFSSSCSSSCMPAHLHVVGMLRFIFFTGTNRACPLL